MIGQGSSNLYETNVFSKVPEGIRPGGLMLTERLVDYCNFVHGNIVVDLGCGTGNTVEYLGNVRGLNAVGVDLSSVLLQRGREHTANLQFIQSTGEEMPFGNHSIAGVVAECSLSVMSDVSRVLAEVNRILVPGGKLAITDLYIRDTSCSVGRIHSTGIMTYDEINQLVQDSGFNIIVFEDQSPLLKKFVVSFIMKHGSMEELWQCTGMDMKDAKVLGIGYYLLIAEKRSVKVKG